MSLLYLLTARNTGNIMNTEANLPLGGRVLNGRRLVERARGTKVEALSEEGAKWLNKNK